MIPPLLLSFILLLDLNVSVASARLQQKNHRGLDIQNYDLPEVQLIVEIWSLIEELDNVWLGLSVQLCGLESPVCNLKV